MDADTITKRLVFYLRYLRHLRAKRGGRAAGALHAAVEKQLAGVDQRIAVGPWRKGLRPFWGVSR